MVSDLMRDFAVGATVLGNLSALYFYAYAGLQIPVGALIDRWGARVMVAGSLAIAATGALTFGSAGTVFQAYAGRLLIGLGSAVGFVGSLALAARWFPERRFALMSGLTMLVGMAAGILGQAPLAALVAAIGWRSTMYISALVAAVLAAAVWGLVRNAPDEAAEQNTSGRSQSWGALVSGIGRTLAAPRVWCVSLFGASLSGVLLAFGGLWGVPYLMLRYGIERPTAAFITSLVLLGWAVGAPFAGWISDHIGRRKLPMVIAAVLNLCLICFLLYGPALPIAVAGVILFLLGGLGGSMVIGYAFAREMTPPIIHGAVTGFVNMMTVISGAILQPLIGLLLDLQWDGTIEEGVRIYSLAQYNLAFAALAGWAALGFAWAGFIPETHCRTHRDPDAVESDPVR